MERSFLRSLRKALLALGSLGVVGASLYVPAMDGRVTAAAPFPSVAPTAPPTPSPTPVPVFTPEGLAMPTLGVDAPIIAVGIEEDGSMGTPGNEVDVGWWDGRAVGQGNALFDGHRDWNGRIGSFGRLSELKPGDPIVLRGEGRELTFHVEWVRQVEADAEAADILGDTDRPAITLITCGGRFDRSIRHYTERVVARALLA